MSLIPSLLFLLILLTYSNFFNLKFKIKFSETFFVSICLIIIISYLLFKFNLLDHVLIVISLISVFTLLYLIKNFSKIDTKLNLEFILIYLIIFLFSKDKYFLDQDEFSYWGQAIKALSYNFDSFKLDHHPQGLTLFRYLFNFNEINEGLAIFSNNIILISGFFYLFYQRTLMVLEKFLLFGAYYLLLNNLSFGFMSIYSDPILAIFYACLLKKLFLMNKDKNFKLDTNFLLVFMTLLTINRSSVIYGFFIIYIFFGLYFINILKNKKKYTIIFFSLIVFSSFIIYQLIIPIVLKGYYEKEIFNFFIDKVLFHPDIFFEQIKSLIFKPIYFSKFGVAINSILEIAFSSNFKIYEFNIPLVTYIGLLFLFLFYNYIDKYLFFIGSLFIILTYICIVLVIKFEIENLHMSALPRYIGIILIAKYLFFIFIISNYYQINFKNYSFLLLLLCLFLITPKKTFGFFVPDKIYYNNLPNKLYKDNRVKISKLNKIKNNYTGQIIVVHKKGFSDYTNTNVSGIHSFYNDVIEFELFPRKPIIIEFDEYVLNNQDLNKNDSLIILYDLPKNLKDRIKSNNDIFEITTYQ